MPSAVRRAGRFCVLIGHGAGVVRMPGSVLGSTPGPVTYWTVKPPLDPVRTTTRAITSARTATPTTAAARRFLRARCLRSASRRARLLSADLRRLWGTSGQAGRRTGARELQDPIARVLLSMPSERSRRRTATIARTEDGNDAR